MATEKKNADSSSKPDDDYGQFYLHDDMNRARIGILFIMIPIIAYVYNDYQFLGLSSLFYEIVALRAGLLLFTLLVVFYISRAKTHGVFEKTVFAYTLILVICMLIIFATRPQNFNAQIILTLLIVFVFYLIIPNRFVNQTIPALIGIAGEIGLIVIFAHTTTTNLFSALLILLFAVAIAASSSWQIQKYRQKGYQEMSERKQRENELRESEEHFRTLAEQSPNMIFINQDGKIVYVNKKGEDVVGYSREEFYSPSFNFLTLSSPEYVEKVKLAWAKHLKGEDIPPYEYALVTREGKRIDALIATKLIDYKGKKAILGIVTDISELKKAENELKQYKENLEALVEERTKQLRNAERLATIGATAGMVGHDIRNPLQAIAGDLYLIDNDVASLSESITKESLQESVKSIQGNLFYIAKIVEDLQDYAKPLKPKFERVKIERVIEDVMVLTAVTSNYQVVIAIEKGFPEITTDFSMLKRIVDNLVKNAVQAMPEGGLLKIAAFRKDNNVIIAVSDTGEGIPESAKANLFKPFMTTKSKGQGLGLAVVKRLVEGLNGIVSFESEAGKGTKFIIELPANQ